uniref:VWFD domain-containing protein n=1 Tax=Elphidium margaritaceum TaxID=933848 RepID=A0A7S0XS64_9EUKA|mmetsp:Transcript_828/g.1604  ORF Transcript_828/g.1604 Transcript_828/m.1604 type:complete len:683 (+) Transcript_828:95-2143(+)
MKAIQFAATLSSLVLVNHAQLFPCPDPTIGDCGRCDSQNDPHITTFDRVYYDQHTDGCFEYVTACPSYSGYLPFSIVACHYDCGTYGGGANLAGGDRPCPSSIRCIGNVSITFYDTSGAATYNISIDHLSSAAAEDDSIGALTVGGSFAFDTAASHSFAYTMSTSGSGPALHTFDVYAGDNSFYGYITYSSGSLTVYLDHAFFAGKVCGLCGQFDADDSNDFLGADAQQYLTASDLAGMGVITQALNTAINNFADTYAVDEVGVTPAPDPNCTVTSADTDCYQDALECCRALWDQQLMTADTTWTNPAMTAAEFFDNWLIGCARDACALTMNNLDCSDFDAFQWQFAIDVFQDTATATYPVTLPDIDDDDDDDAKNCTAKICAHADNYMTLEASFDGGATYAVVDTVSSWMTTLGGGWVSVSPIDALTILRFTVEDVGVVGGLLATVKVCGNNGYELELFTTDTGTMYFDVVSSSDGNTVLSEFTPFGGEPWAYYVNKEKVTCMNPEADWVWNGNTGNTMVFDVDFGRHPNILEKLDCLPDATPAPTQTDCCDLSIEEYLDQCYCSATPTPSPLTKVTPTPLHIAVEDQIAVASNLKSASAHTVGGINSIPHAPHSVIYTDPMVAKLAAEVRELKLVCYALLASILTCLLAVAFIKVCQTMQNNNNKMRRVKVLDDESDQEF